MESPLGARSSGNPADWPAKEKGNGRKLLDEILTDEFKVARKKWAIEGAGTEVENILQAEIYKYEQRYRGLEHIVNSVR